MSTMPVFGDWMTIREAAEKIGVSVQRVHQLIDVYGMATKPINRRMKLVRGKDVERVASMDRPDGVRLDRRQGS